MTKRYLLTGGSDGLGKEFALLCLAKDIEIVCIDRVKPDYNCHYIQTDLVNEKEIENAANIIKDKYNCFDALVNCAGVTSLQSANEITYSEIQRVHGINLLAPIYLTSQLFDTIKANEADILNVGSTAGTKPYLKHIVYGSAKQALRNFSQNLQLELKDTKCRVIQCNPGGFKSKIYEKFTGQEAEMTGFMNPKDIAAIMLYTLELPKSVEISEILISRKAA